MRLIVAAFAALATVSAWTIDPNSLDVCVAKCGFETSTAVGCRGMMDKECLCKGYAGTHFPEYMETVFTCFEDNGCGPMGSGDLLSLCLFDTLCEGPNFVMCNGFCYDTRFQANPCAPKPGPVVSDPAPVCGDNEKTCRTGKTSHVCIDTKNDVSSCGGCPAKGGVDCKSLPGVLETSCESGKCRATACAPGLTLINGKCK